MILIRPTLWLILTTFAAHVYASECIEALVGFPNTRQLMKDFGVAPKDKRFAQAMLQSFRDHTWYNIWKYLSGPNHYASSNSDFRSRKGQQKIAVGFHLLLHPSITPDVLNMAEEVLSGWEEWSEQSKRSLHQIVAKYFKGRISWIEAIKSKPNIDLDNFFAKHSNTFLRPISEPPTFSKQKRISYNCLGGVDASLCEFAYADLLRTLAGISNPEIVQIQCGPSPMGSYQFLLEHDLVFTLEGASFYELAAKNRKGGRSAAFTLRLGQDYFSTPDYLNGFYSALALLLLDEVSKPLKQHKSRTSKIFSPVQKKSCVEDTSSCENKAFLWPEI